LGTAVGLAWAAAARKLHAKAPRCLRPPGALQETQFVGLCVRCGNCARACPTNIIEPDLGEHGIAGLLAPVVGFRDDYCREDCTRCTDVCPSGALVPLAVDDKLTAPIGRPRVDMNVCLLGDDRECAACRNNCPYSAIVYVFSEVEYTLTPQIDLNKCPGCGACELACPTTPGKAIVIGPC
jgi:ferredoxin-type protein NapF